MITQQQQRRRRPDEIDDEEEQARRRVVPPGSRVRVDLLSMDAVQREIVAAGLGVHIGDDGAVTRIHDGMGHRAGHKPGYAFADSGDRRAADRAYAERSAALQDAWRTPASDADDIRKPAAPRPTADAQRAAADAYNARSRDLENAWRS